MDKLNLNLNGGERLNIGLSERQNLNLKVMGASGGGTKNYNDLYNKPQIEGITLQGNKTYEELNMHRITNMELENILN